MSQEPRQPAQAEPWSEDHGEPHGDRHPGDGHHRAHVDACWLHGFLVAALTAGCAPEGLEAPSPGGVVQGLELPVIANLPRRPDRVRLELDGVRVEEQAVGVVHERTDSNGGGWDWVGLLDLGQVEPGSHRLELASDAGHRASTFTFDPPACRLDVAVVDGDGAPLDARVVLIGEDGPANLASPDAVAVDYKGRDLAWDSVVTRDGVAAARVACGTWRLVAVRDVRHDLGTATVKVADVAGVTLVVPRVFDTPGELLADLHVHSARSHDSMLPEDLRWRSLAAAGLEVVVLTDHDLVGDAADTREVLGQAHLGVVTGTEHDLFVDQGAGAGGEAWGHLNAFPLAADVRVPPTEDLSLAALLEGWRAAAAQRPAPGTQGEVLLQLNHPRGIHFTPELQEDGAWALLSAAGYDRDDPLGQGGNAGFTAADMDFDLLEVVNRWSWDRYLAVREDWFSLLDHGFWLTGTGNSDTHALAVELAGFPVNLVRLDDPADAAGLVRALAWGRVRVSTGPLVGLEVVAGDDVVLPGEVARGSGPRVARAHVQAAPWVPVDEVRLIQDGRVVGRVPGPVRDSRGVLDAWVELPFDVVEDGWVLAEAGQAPEALPDPSAWPTYAEVLPLLTPLAFTNPVCLDADADGRWTP